MSTKTKVGKFIRWIYANLLRPYLIGALNDPNSEMDEQIIAILDKLFNYKQ